MYYGFTVDSPVGKLYLAEQDGALTHLLFAKEARPDGLVREETPLLRAAAQQLVEYFAGLRREFELPLAPQGTAFRMEVWRQLQRIPYGETRSYKDIAAAIGKPSAVRAVGQANHHNPISIIIPCHRVVGADGRLTGYGGGMAAKELLLRLEQKGV